MNNWHLPPPEPLGLPEPTYPEPPRSFPDFPAPELFPLQLPVYQHPSSPASPSVSPDSPPLRGLASKFAAMIGRGTSPGAASSSAKGVLAPPGPPVARGHGYSKSLGQPVSPYWEQPDEPTLSGEELERLAMEEREWSRREAERLMALEREQQQQQQKGSAFGFAAGPSASKEPEQDRTPRKIVSRPNSFFDASSTPPSAVPPPRQDAPVVTSSTSLPAPQIIPRTESLPALPAQPSPYLLAHPSDPEALDVPGSLIALARKFEKLELYSVTHLRALASRMGDLEGRVKELEGREGVVQVRREMRELKGAMADGFRALEGEIENLGRRERDGFGLGVKAVEKTLSEEPQVLEERPDLLPALSSSASSASSSHHMSLKTPSPGAFDIERFTDATPLAINKSATSTPTLQAPAPAPASHLHHSGTPGSSPVPPRKRYTALLSSRTCSVESTPSPRAVSPLQDATADVATNEDVAPQSQSTPLPSAPFPPGRAQTALLPSPTRPLFIKSASHGSPSDSPTRRRARSVGASLSSSTEDGAAGKRTLGEDVKASNRGRAPVGKLISAWERK